MATDSFTIGKSFIVGVSDTKLTSSEGKLLSKLKPSGIILFRHNFTKSPDWPSTLANLIENIKNEIDSEKIFVSIDHEGGAVHRLPSPATHFPVARTWKSKAFDVGLAMGKELSALGFNLDFAPVLDATTEPENKVIGMRSFSEKSEEVAEMGIAFIKGLQENNVLACGKHFPGHGATTADSHFELPCVNCSMDTLTNRELIPFVEVINSNCLQMMMTAHVMYPALDAENPATISKIILTDLLRNKLNFPGIIITDALEMKALSEMTPETASLKSMLAGADIVLVAKPENVIPAEIALSSAKQIDTQCARDNALKINRDLSLERIDSVLSKLPNTENGLVNDKEKFAVLGCTEHSNLDAELRAIA